MKKIATGILLTLGLSAMSGTLLAESTACNNGGFKNYYSTVKHGNAGKPEYKRFDLKAGTYGGFNNYNLQYEGIDVQYYGQRYKLVATTEATKRWSVAVCTKVKQSDYYYNRDHYLRTEDDGDIFLGPRIQFQAKMDDGSWKTLQATDGSLQWAYFDLSNTDKKQKNRWKWNSNSLRQFRVVIDRAMHYDEFDIIMDW
jgi:hypothetical protein